VIAEQHLHIADTRPGYIGSIATHLDVADALEFAGQRAAQVIGDMGRGGAGGGGGGGVCRWVLVMKVDSG
jgi:hypothetical protein